MLPPGTPSLLLAAKLTYHLTKDPGNDSRFRMGGMLPRMLSSIAAHCNSSSIMQSRSRVCSAGIQRQEGVLEQQLRQQQELEERVEQLALKQQQQQQPQQEQDQEHQEQATAAEDCSSGQQQQQHRQEALHNPHVVAGGRGLSSRDLYVDVLLYLVGAMKNLSADSANQKALVRLGALGVCSLVCEELISRQEQTLQQQQQSNGSAMQHNKSRDHQQQPQQGQQQVRLVREQEEALAQVGVQVTGLLRNLAVWPGHAMQFISASALPGLSAGITPPGTAAGGAGNGMAAAAAHTSRACRRSTSSSSSSNGGGGAVPVLRAVLCLGKVMFAQHEVLLNVSRVLSKLSCLEVCQEWLAEEPEAVKCMAEWMVAADEGNGQLLQEDEQQQVLPGDCYSELKDRKQHQRSLEQQQALLLRLAYALGNLTTSSSVARVEAAGTDGWVGWLIHRCLSLSATGEGNRGSRHGHAATSHQSQEADPWGSTSSSVIQQRPRASSTSSVNSSSGRGGSIRPLSGCGGLGATAASGHATGRYSLAGAAATAAALAAASAGSSGRGTPSVQGGAAAVAGGEEELLVKLLRLIANLGVEPSIGQQLVNQPATATVLLNVLQHYSFDHQEEVVLNAVAALTNLSFYNIPSNQVRKGPRKASGISEQLLLLTTPLASGTLEWNLHQSVYTNLACQISYGNRLTAYAMLFESEPFLVGC